MNPLLTKAYLAGGTISARRAVKFSASGTVVQAAAATDSIIGVSRGNQTDTLVGDRIDVQEEGIADCDAGGTIVRGGMVTSDASGKMVAATGAVTVIGQALESAAAGDIFPVKLVAFLRTA